LNAVPLAGPFPTFCSVPSPSTMLFTQTTGVNSALLTVDYSKSPPTYKLVGSASWRAECAGGALSLGGTLATGAEQPMTNGHVKGTALPPLVSKWDFCQPRSPGCQYW
jgi:hypothetical protein